MPSFFKSIAMNTGLYSNLESLEYSFKLHIPLGTLWRLRPVSYNDEKKNDIL